MTALGPNDRSTVWYQPPTQSHISDDMIDPELQPLVPSARPPAISQVNTNDTRSFGTNITGALNKVVSAPNSERSLVPKLECTPHPPKSSSYAHEAIAIAKVPAKRTLAETLMDIQR